MPIFSLLSPSAISRLMKTVRNLKNLFAFSLTLNCFRLGLTRKRFFLVSTPLCVNIRGWNCVKQKKKPPEKHQKLFVLIKGFIWRLWQLQPEFLRRYFILMSCEVKLSSASGRILSLAYKSIKLSHKMFLLSCWLLRYVLDVVLLPRKKAKKKKNKLEIFDTFNFIRRRFHLLLRFDCSFISNYELLSERLSSWITLSFIESSVSSCNLQLSHWTNS